MKAKRFLLSALAATLILSLAGCISSYGNAVTIGSMENQYGNLAEMSYQKFDGWKAYVITLLEGESMEVTVNVTSEEGKLSFAALDHEENILYEKSDLESGEFSFTLEGEERYALRMTGEDHKGGYKIVWDITKPE